jgi:hypothetical protein
MRVRSVRIAAAGDIGPRIKSPLHWHWWGGRFGEDSTRRFLGEFEHLADQGLAQSIEKLQLSRLGVPAARIASLFPARMLGVGEDFETQFRV